MRGLRSWGMTGARPLTLAVVHGAAGGICLPVGRCGMGGQGAYKPLTPPSEEQAEFCLLFLIYFWKVHLKETYDRQVSFLLLILAWRTVAVAVV